MAPQQGPNGSSTASSSTSRRDRDGYIVTLYRCLTAERTLSAKAPPSTHPSERRREREESSGMLLPTLSSACMCDRVILVVHVCVEHATGAASVWVRQFRNFFLYFFRAAFNARRMIWLLGVVLVRWTLSECWMYECEIVSVWWMYYIFIFLVSIGGV